MQIRFLGVLNWKGTAKRISVLTVITGMAVSLSGCFLLPREEAVLAPPLKEPTTVNYDTQEVKRGTIEKKITCIGYFVSVSQNDLSFKPKGGYLKSLNIKTGDKVKAGDVLAEMDTDNLESQIRQQELNLRKARAVYDKLKSAGGESKEAIEAETARLQLDEIQRQFDKVESARLNLKPGVTLKDLFKDVEYDSLKNQLEQKRLALAKAEEAYSRELDNAALNVDIEAMKLEDLNIDLRKSKLSVPIDGEVVYIDNKINLGDYITAYKAFIRVADPTQLQLQYTDATKVSDFRLGMRVDIKIDGKMYGGQVVMTPAEAPLDADESLKKSIRIRVDNLPKEVQIGNSADISLTLEKRDDVLVIPKNAIKFFGGRKYVQILEDGIKKERDVETGIETVTESEIIKGLKEGDKIILR